MKPVPALVICLLALSGGVLFVAFQDQIQQSLPWNSPDEFDLPELSPPGPGDRLLVLTIEFTDAAAPLTTVQVQERLFGGDGSLRDYYNEISYGEFDLEGTVAGGGWLQSSRPHAYYGANVGGEIDSGTSGTEDPWGVVTEAVKLADSAIDYTDYDNNNDGFIDYLLVVHSGNGEEGGGGSNTIWSHMSFHGGEVQNGDRIFTTVDDIHPGYYAVVGGSSHFNTWAHEMGHLWGVPDLYDTNLSDGSDSEGLGWWDLMASGNWRGQNNNTPPHFSAWSKAHTGWVDPVELTASGEFWAPPVELDGLVYRIPINSNGTEYFLLENRQWIGYDASLPGTGLAIYHIDETVGDLARNDVNNIREHKRIDLEEADGRNDLDTRANKGDAGDLYRNSAAGFGPETDPSSDSYSGVTGIGVRNITVHANDTISFDLEFHAGVGVRLEPSSMEIPPSPIELDLVIGNYGDEPDRVDIEITDTRPDFLTPWEFHLWLDGEELTDSDSDGFPDLPSLGALEEVTVVLEIIPPINEAHQNIINITVHSTNDPSIYHWDTILMNLFQEGGFLDGPDRVPVTTGREEIVTFTLTNGGSNDLTFFIDILPTQFGEADFDSLFVRVGESETFEVTFTVPNSAGEGKHDIQLIITGAGASTVVHEIELEAEDSFIRTYFGPGRIPSILMSIGVVLFVVYMVSITAWKPESEDLDIDQPAAGPEDVL